MPIIISFGIAILLGIAGGLLTEIGPWYRNLRRPRLNPPDWLFGPAWTIILGLAAWSATIAWKAAANDEQRRLVLLLFGAKRLPDAARGLGRSLRIFKAETKGLTDPDPTPPTAAVPPPATGELAPDPSPAPHAGSERQPAPPTVRE